MNFNPYRSGLMTNAAEPNKGGSAAIEQPHAIENIVWQTRAADLTAFEDELAEKLQAVFRNGVEALDAIVAELNRSGPRHPDGAWTEQNYQSLMARLAAGQSL